MTIDFDRLVNGPVLASFGETVSYTPKGRPAFDLTVIWDQAWKSLDPGTSRYGAGIPVSTTKPVAGLRDADFPTGLKPRQGDRVTRQKTGENFVVSDAQPDGASGWTLITFN